MKFLGYLRIQHLYQIILSPTDQSDDMDFIEKNATVFAELIQHLDNKSLSLVIRDARDNGRKALTSLKEHYLSKVKLKVISLYIELTSLRRLESESITDYIRTENIFNALKEAGEVISHRLLIVMVLKGLPPNFKPFTMVITQKKKTLTFSEFKVCLRSYEETERIYYPLDESNSILQMKTTFKKINPKNKTGVSTHSFYDYKSTNYNYNNYLKPQHSREDYQISPQGRQILFFRFVGRETTKYLNVKTKGKEIFVIIYKPILKVKPIFLL